MRIYLFLIFSLFGFNSSFGSADITLTATCENVPQSSDQLCHIITESPWGPFDDVAFYRLSDSGSAFLLAAYSGGGGIYNGTGYSEGGGFMWLSFAEEGHPYFIFYRTQDFLEVGQHADSIATLGDYYFEDFRTFADSGEVTYFVSTDEDAICEDTNIVGSQEAKVSDLCFRRLKLDVD
ncbi:MAG: hypothetical protein OEY09_16965 [Gammaproteobacteria bacterium]|nr:hypothetical protein [Gammaproteobacteria bacterium]